MGYFETNRSTIKRYLIEEQGYDDEEVAEMSLEELQELWEHYHEY